MTFQYPISGWKYSSKKYKITRIEVGSSNLALQPLVGEEGHQDQQGTGQRDDVPQDGTDGHDHRAHGDEL